MRSALLVSACLLLAACDGSARVWITERPELAGPDALVFPSTRPGRSERAALDVQNVGGAAGTWSVIATEGFRVEVAELALVPGASASFDVYAEPVSWADTSGQVVFAEADGSTFTVSLGAALLRDADEDGAEHPSAGGTDCDDDDPDVRPGAPDACYDGIDADCAADDDDDCDGDGAPVPDDCDDTRNDVSPWITETRADASDDDCDGQIDEHLWAAGELVITEVHPAAPSWMEVCVAGARDVRLDGLLVRSEAGPLPLPSGPALAPGACASVCANAVQACTFTLPALTLTDPGVVSVSADGVIDEVPFDAGWPVAGSRTHTLGAGNDAVSNDVPGAWCLGDGSPGERNEACQ